MDFARIHKSSFACEWRRSPGPPAPWGPVGAWWGAWSQRVLDTLSVGVQLSSLLRRTVKGSAPILILIIIFITASTAFETSPNRRACWNRVQCNGGHGLGCGNGRYVTLAPWGPKPLILQGKIKPVFSSLCTRGPSQRANMIGAGAGCRGLVTPRGRAAWRVTGPPEARAAGRAGHRRQATGPLVSSILDYAHSARFASIARAGTRKIPHA